MTRIEVDLPEWLKDWLEEKGEAIDEFLSDIERAGLEGLADGLEIASLLPPGPPTGRPSDPVRIAAELFLSKLLRDAADRLREDSRSSNPPRGPRYGGQTPPQSAPDSDIDQVQRQLLETKRLEAFNDRIDELNRRSELAANAYYQLGDWEQEFLDDPGFGGRGIVSDQLPGDLREFGSASGRVTAQTWLLGDAIQYGLAPALSGAVDSITPADIAFGETGLSYEGLQWVSDDVLEGLTVNGAAMSGAVTPWAAGISEQVEQRRRELEAFRPQPAPATRRDSPPGSGSPGGGLSWDEGLDLYQRRSGENAQNIEWMRTHRDAKAESGPNAEWTFREIVPDAVKKSDLVPIFAVGGIVPGMVGTPVPAVVHSGERIVGAGNAGGIPINLDVHVHGTVISEGDLANNVRNGLMRRLS